MLKYFLIFPLMVASLSLYSQDCSRVARATSADQKKMAMDVTFLYLGEDARDIIEINVDDYVSWKENQKGCLADVLHYAKINVVVKKAQGSRCTISLELHAKDYFVSSENFEREYKPRNVTRTCQDETLVQEEIRLKCDQQKACPFNNDIRLFRQYDENCSCVLFDKLIKFVNVQDQYKDFFSPEVDFNRPEDIPDMF